MLPEGWSGLIVALLVLLSSTAAAQDRVAVVGFSGPRAGAAAAGVRRALEDQYEIVDTGEWRQASAELGVRGLSARSIIAVAAELGVRAVVSGGIRRARRRWAVGVVVRDGATGQVIGRRGAAIATPARAAGAAAALARALIDDIEEAEGAGPPPDSGEDAVGEVDEAEDDGGTDYDFSDLDQERPPGMVDEGSRQVEDTELVGGGEGGDDGPRDPGDRSPYGWLELALEVNIASRRFNVPINPVCDLPWERPEATLESGVYPEIGLRLAFFPGSLAGNRWWSNIGLEASYHHHLYLKIVNTSQGLEIDAEQQAVGVGLVYRAPIGSRGTTLQPRVGWERYDFFLGNVGNNIVPPLVYDALYLGLDAEIGLVRGRLAMELGGHYLGVLSIGQEAIEAFNAPQQYPSTHGLFFSAGLSGTIWRGLRWRVAFEFRGFFSTHEGKGQGWGSGDSSTLCDESCARVAACDESAPGGIQTTGTAHDLTWRLAFQISYRFGWRPDAFGSSGARDDDDDDDDDDEGGDDDEESLDETFEDEDDWEW